MDMAQRGKRGKRHEIGIIDQRDGGEIMDGGRGPSEVWGGVSVLHPMERCEMDMAQRGKRPWEWREGGGSCPSWAN